MKLVRQQTKNITPNEESILQDDEEPSTNCQEEEIPQPDIIELFSIHPLTIQFCHRVS
jgi:hypothetical protein